MKPRRTEAGAKAPANEDGAASLLDARRRDLTLRLNTECALYINTGDARFFWRAFLHLYDAGEPIPQDFLDKFAEWGQKVLAADSPREIALALELAGTDKKHAGRAQGETYRRNWRIGSEVEQVRKLFGVSLEEAIRIVGRNRKLHISVVKTAHDKAFRAPVRKQRKARQGEDSISLQEAVGTWRRRSE